MKAFVAIAAAAWAVAAGSAFAGQVAIPSSAGHAEIRIEGDASRFSVLARGETFAAASPLGPVTQDVDENPDAPLTIYVYTGANGRYDGMVAKRTSRVRFVKPGVSTLKDFDTFDAKVSCSGRRRR